MKNLNVYREEFVKKGAAVATAFTLMFTPVLAGETHAEGLEGLLNSYGIEAQQYTTTTLDVPSWERGFIESYQYYTPFIPSLKEQSGLNLAAMYYFTNYNFTPVDIVPELAAKGYISENNCVDLGVIRRDDPNTAEDETMTEIVDMEGFYNFINAQNGYNQINDMAERRMHADWIALKGEGHLDPANYPDPSVFIQDPRQRDIVHDWYVAFVEGYDLTPGTFSGNDKLQYVYRAIGQLDGDRDEPSLNSLDPSVAYLVRATLGNWFKVFTENYMYTNYLDEIVHDLHYYDGRELGDNESFVKYPDAEPIPDQCVSELKELINDREALHRITTVDLPDNLFNMLQQRIIPYDEYMDMKEQAAKKKQP